MKNQKSSLTPTGLPVGASLDNFSKPRRLSARTGFHTKTFFRWADAGFIHRYKINGRVVLFDDAEVIAYIKSTRVN
jgi:hypothetical protein